MLVYEVKINKIFVPELAIVVNRQSTVKSNNKIILHGCQYKIVLHEQKHKQTKLTLHFRTVSSFQKWEGY